SNHSLPHTTIKATYLSAIAMAVKERLTGAVLNILSARENHADKKLVELYDPDRMPPDLAQAHLNNDIIVEKLYQNQEFESDEQRLDSLFRLYGKLVGGQNA
ncbi:MAG: type IIL restriction-modification enzyme MmeI, partial [Pseudomonadota bacterium]